MKVEVLTGVERRRRWSPEEKARIVAETLEPNVSVCEVARRHGVAQSLVFTWRRQMREGRKVEPIMVPVEISGTMPAALSSPAGLGRPRRKTGLIEIELGDGRCIRVDRSVDADALRRVLDVLERR